VGNGAYRGAWLFCGLLACGPAQDEGEGDSAASPSTGTMDGVDSDTRTEPPPGSGEDTSTPSPDPDSGEADCDHCDDDLSCCHGDLTVYLTEATASFELSIVELDAVLTCADGELVSAGGLPSESVVCLSDMTGVRIIGDTYDNAYSGQSLTASLDGAPPVALRFDGENYKSCDCNATPLDITFSFPMCPCGGEEACTDSPALEQSCGQDIGATCCDNNERLECGQCDNECSWAPAC